MKNFTKFLKLVLPELLHLIGKLFPAIRKAFVAWGKAVLAVVKWQDFTARCAPVILTALFFLLTAIPWLPYLTEDYKNIAPYLQIGFGALIGLSGFCVIWAYFEFDRECRSARRGLLESGQMFDKINREGQKLQIFSQYSRVLNLATFLAGVVGMSLGAALFFRGLYFSGYQEGFDRGESSLDFWSWLVFTPVNCYPGLKDELEAHTPLRFIDNAGPWTTAIVYLIALVFNYLVIRKVLYWTNDYLTARKAVRAFRKTNDAEAHESIAETLRRLGEPGIRAIEWGGLGPFSKSIVVQRCLQVLGDIGGKSETPLILTMLNHEDASIRRMAVRALGDVGDYEYSIVEELMRMINDHDYRVSEEAILSIGKMGSSARIAIFDLCQLFHVTEIDNHVILTALRNIGPFAHRAVNPVIDIAHDSDTAPHTAALAVLTLGSIGKDRPEAITFLRQSIEDETNELCGYAIEALGQTGDSAKEAVPRLIELLESNNVQLRRLTIRALGKIGKHAAPAVPTLIQNCRDCRHNLLFEDTVETLGKIGPQAGAAVPLLIDHLTHNRNTGIVQEFLLPAIQKIVEEIPDDIVWTDPKLDKLAALLAHESSEVRLVAIVALGIYGSDAKEYVDLLILRLSDSDPKLHEVAAWALGRIGGPAQKAVQQLIAMSNTAPPKERNAAIWALGDIGPKADDAVPALIQHLKGEAAQTAAMVLGRIGKPAHSAVPHLIEAALNHPENSVRRRAIWALGTIGEPEDDILDALVKVLNTSDRPDLLGRAASAIGSLGRAAQPALPVLIATLQAAARHDPPRSGVGHACTLAILKIGRTDPQRAVAALLSLFAEETSDAQVKAAWAFGELGKYSEQAIPVLIQALHSPNRELRGNAVESLGDIYRLADLNKRQRQEVASAIIALRHRETDEWVKSEIDEALTDLSIPF